MNLYKISQSVNNCYDTFSDAIVAAETADEARYIHPQGYEHQRGEWAAKLKDTWYEDECDDWAAPGDVRVSLVGVAEGEIPKGVILASFHAG